MVQGLLPTDTESQLYSQIAHAMEQKKIVYLQEFLNMREQLHNVVDLASKLGKPPEIVLVEVQDFGQVTQVIEALKVQKTVCLNLSLVNPETSQRVIDFLMGGTLAIDCQQTCIGENVYLLTPDRVVLSQPQERE